MVQWKVAFLIFLIDFKINICFLTNIALRLYLNLYMNLHLPSHQNSISLYLFEASLVTQFRRSTAVQLICNWSGFHPWIRKIPWKRKWWPTAVFLPGESHGQKSLTGYSPWVARVSHESVTKPAHTFISIFYFFHHYFIQQQVLHVLCWILT